MPSSLKIRKRMALMLSFFPSPSDAAWIRVLTLRMQWYQSPYIVRLSRTHPEDIPHYTKSVLNGI